VLSARHEEMTTTSHVARYRGRKGSHCSPEKSRLTGAGAERGKEQAGNYLVGPGPERKASKKKRPKKKREKPPTPQGHQKRAAGGGGARVLTRRETIEAVGRHRSDKWQTGLG